MTDAPLPLAGDFPPATHADWMALVEKALNGAPFEKKLVTRTLDGLSIQPLYTREHWSAEHDPSGMPGAMPFTRGSHALAQAMSGWDIRQSHANPDVAATKAAIEDDLDNSVTSLLLRLDAAGRAGLDADDPAAADLFGKGGLSLSSLADLDAVLSDVDLTKLPIAFDAGAQAPAIAALMEALWCQRGVTETQAKAAFNIDPLGTLAETGSLPTSVDTALEQMAAVAAHTAQTFPGGAVTAVGVHTSPYYNAGSSEAQDLACAMATGVAYLRAMEAAGLSLDDAARQIQFTFSLGTEQFLSIAKLRAARLMWARITEACGVSEPARGTLLYAITARRIMTRRDPWVNLLRNTIVCFSAAIGGAKGITILPHDAALGIATPFSRRIARNTQLILEEESQLNRVIDPVGGSWALENITEELAAAAWGLFQGIEKDGGMAQALQSGRIAEQIADIREKRRKDLAKRKLPITGVSEFAKLDEQAPEVATPDLPTLRQAASASLAAIRAASTAPALSAGASPTDRATAALKGATLSTLAKAAATDKDGVSIPALPPHTLAEDFEALRDASDAYLEASGSRPQIFLANLGPIAHHTGRATYSSNLFAAGGIESLSNEGFKDADSCAAAFKESGAKAAVLCSSDKIYEDLAVPAAQALKAAGCQVLYLAGRPGDNQEAYTSAGIDRFIYMGCDVLGTLRDLHADLGVSSR